MGQGVIWLEADRRAIFFDRLIELALLKKSSAEVVVDLGVIWLKAECRAVFCYRLVKTPELAKCIAEISVDSEASRTDRDRSR